MFPWGWRWLWLGERAGLSRQRLGSTAPDLRAVYSKEQTLVALAGGTSLLAPSISAGLWRGWRPWLRSVQPVSPWMSRMAWLTSVSPPPCAFGVLPDGFKVRGVSDDQHFLQNSFVQHILSRSGLGLTLTFQAGGIRGFPSHTLEVILASLHGNIVVISPRAAAGLERELSCRLVG